MSFKSQRESQLKYLYETLDCTLLTYNQRYSHEKVEYYCNKCRKNHSWDFSMALLRIKHKQVCNCHFNEVSEDIDMYKFSNFVEVKKEIIQEKKTEKEKRDEFSLIEHKEYCESVKKNRNALMYKYQNNEHYFKCKHGHLFTVTPFNLMIGKWCPDCEQEGEKFYE